MDDLTLLSANKVADLIQNHAISPVEVVEAYLARIEKLNPALNAIVTLAPDPANPGAGRGSCFDERPDAGPTAWRAAYDQGHDRHSRSQNYERVGPPRNMCPNWMRQLVARLKAAGAIILGKTNTAELAMDYTADNPVFGRTNNPHDHSRTPGGSSGGEAAAIASGMSPGGLGSDLAGSIRLPAHFCGIAGLKPGSWRVPGGGQFPESVGPYTLGSTIGPMARSVADLDLLFRVLSGSETPKSTPSNQLRTQQQALIVGQRVAWFTDDGVVPVTAETHAAVIAAARALADAGLVVEECRPPGVERGFDLWLKLFSRASVVTLREAYREREAEAGAFVRWRLATADDAPTRTLDEYITDWIERDRLRRALVQWMDTTPLIVCPVGATPAFAHDVHKVTIAGQSINTFRAFSYSQTFNVFDLPAATVPAGRSAEGLPIGVQIVGRPNEEAMVLAAAAMVEQALGDCQPLSDKL